MNKKIICFALFVVCEVAAAAKPLWQLVKTVDKMTDERRCRLSYTPSPYIWLSSDDVLTVSYLRRGGVAGFRYRVDKQPASDMMDGTLSKNYIEIFVSDGELMGAKRVVIDGLTVLNSSIDLDIDLTGFDAARAAMADQCGVKPMQKKAPVEWPSPTTNVPTPKP